MAMSLKASVGPLDRASSHRLFSRWRRGTISPRAEYFRGVRLGAQGFQVGRRNVVDVQRQDLEGQLGVALLVVRLAQAREHGVVHLRVVLWQVQATIGCQAFEQDVAELFAVCVTARAEVFHERVP